MHRWDHVWGPEQANHQKDLLEAVLTEKTLEISELNHAIALNHDTLHQRKEVIETQKEQLEEETRKHHIVNEQLNDVEGALRHLKSEHTLLQMQLKTSQVQSLCSPSLSRARARARSLSCSLARSFALSQQSVYRDANRSIRGL